MKNFMTCPKCHGDGINEIMADIGIKEIHCTACEGTGKIPYDVLPVEKPSIPKEVLLLTPEQRKLVAELVEDALFAGEERPDYLLRGVGYKRYDKREEEYQHFLEIVKQLREG